jgi:hypothetical protein
MPADDGATIGTASACGVASHARACNRLAECFGPPGYLARKTPTKRRG